MKIGSLFSGYGGLDLAALELFPNAEIAWHCEYDTAPSKILSHHYPNVPNHHDVTEIDWSTTAPVDILTGGYPCQPFSAAGRRKGTEDERHLWPYVRQAIRHLRPRFTLLENVAGHRSMGFDRVLGDCAEDGLHVQWTSLRASDIGACHRRERLFILVTDPNNRTGHRERPRTEPRQRSEDAADPSSGRWESINDSASSKSSRSPRDGQPSGSNRSSSAPVALLPTPRASRGASATETVEALGYDVARLLPTVRASDGTGGPNPLSREERMDDVETRVIRIGSEWGIYEPAIRRQERLSRPAPTPTQLSTKGNPRLAPAFAEWMQFLPAGHVTDPAINISRNEQLKAIGNGVCPPQAFAAYTPMVAQHYTPEVVGLERNDRSYECYGSPAERPQHWN